MRVSDFVTEGLQWAVQDDRFLIPRFEISSADVLGRNKLQAAPLN